MASLEGYNLVVFYLLHLKSGLTRGVDKKLEIDHNLFGSFHIKL
jgi:hypothetical protein